MPQLVAQLMSETQSECLACDKRGVHTMLSRRDIWLTLPDVFWVAFGRETVSTVLPSFQHFAAVYTRRLLSIFGSL